ncbi:hypothetical protein EV368DRAFT_45618, partial [Lentinula lateritia]
SFPIETKLKAPHPLEGWKHRGYSGIGREQVSQLIVDPDELRAIRTGKFPDFKGSFDLGSEDSQTLPNNWIPDEDLPGFRTYPTNFYNTCREFQLSILLPALALGLDLPKDFFLGYHEANGNQLRLLHYSGAPTSAFESGERGSIGAHTDFGTGTLLMIAVVWKSKLHRRGLLYNIGDFLMRWSNDTLKSTLHRVRAPPGRDDQGDDGTTKERFSMVMLIYVRFTSCHNPSFMGADKENTMSLSRLANI